MTSAAHRVKCSVSFVTSEIRRNFGKRPVVVVVEGLDAFLKEHIFAQIRPSAVRTVAASILNFTKERTFSGVLLGVTESLAEIPYELQSVFVYKMEIPSLRIETKQELLRRYLLSAKERLGRGTILHGEELQTIVSLVMRRGQGLHPSHLKFVAEALMASPTVNSWSIERVFKRLYAFGRYAQFRVPEVHWDDLGALDDAKAEISNLIRLRVSPSSIGQRSERMRSGLLLHGPPGTGKTLLAKAIANDCGVHFIAVKGPELLNMYIGESERNIRLLFDEARRTAPCVIFFDEIDSIAPARGKGSDSGGVMDRVVAQLLLEMDRLPPQIYIIGATNRPELLDPALKRFGRFDRSIYIGIPKNKLPILQALTRKIRLYPDNITKRSSSSFGSRSQQQLLSDIAEKLPAHFTGADCKGLCSEALLLALKERGQQIDDMAETLQLEPAMLQQYFAQLETAAGSTYPKAVGHLRISQIDNEPDHLLLECSHSQQSYLWDATQFGPLEEILHPAIGQHHFEQALSVIRPSVSPEIVVEYESKTSQPHPTALQTAALASS